MAAFYDTSWIAAVCDAWGDACHLRLLVRDKANALIDITGPTYGEVIESVNPIEREVERAVGVMQGQTWEVAFTASDATWNACRDLDGCWCQLRAVIGEHDQPLATGRIRRAPTNSDGLMGFEVEDVLVELVNAKFENDAGWYGGGFAGLIYTKDAGNDYDNDWDQDGEDEGVEVIAQGTDYLHIPTAVWTITFTSATTFTVATTGYAELNKSITADVEITAPGASGSLFRIRSAGWSQDAGAYAAGDTFTFATTAYKSGQYRSPVEILRDLMDDIVGITVKNVLTGSDFASPRYDDVYLGEWWKAQDATDDQYWSGTVRRGDSVIDAVQGILRVLNWAIFCAPDGRIALHRPQPGEDSTVELRGDWGSGAVNVIDSQREESMDQVANVVRFTYLDQDGKKQQIEYRDANSPYQQKLIKEIEIPWRVPFTVMRTAASQTLARLQRARTIFRANTMFAGAAIVPGERFTLHDPAARIENVGLTASRVRIDAADDEASVEGFVDALAGSGFFRIGDSNTDPVGSRIGGEGDPGAGMMW